MQGLKLAEVWQTCLLLHMSGFLKVCPSGTNSLRRLTGNDKDNILLSQPINLRSWKILKRVLKINDFCEIENEQAPNQCLSVTT